MRVHALMAGSTSNGPGKSFVIWFQGCNQNCPGCCNPETHDPKGGYEITVEDLTSRIRDRFELWETGSVVFTGGEPTDQYYHLEAMLKRLKQIRPKLTRVLFTGLEPDELLSNFQTLVCLCDVIVAGPYRRDSPAPGIPLLSSDNQKLMLPSGRVHISDLMEIDDIEALLDEEGNYVLTGIGAPQLQEAE